MDLAMQHRKPKSASTDRPDRARPRRPLILRRIVAPVVCLVTLWISVGVTATLTLPSKYPEQIGLLWPIGAMAMASEAAQLMNGKTTPASLAEARVLAEDALRRDPLNVIAVRSLGFARAGQGDIVAAKRILDYAETLSRRDLPTEFWQIERNVADGNIEGALAHYDHALRTVPASIDVLLPVLVTAADDPAVREPLMAMLRRRPVWGRHVVERSASESGNPQAIYGLAKAYGLSMAEPMEAVTAQNVLAKLIGMKAYGPAYDLYQSLTRGDAARTVRDGDFERDNQLPPFDWWLLDEPTLAAVREPRTEAGSYALSLIGKTGRGGEVARQFLMLSPGRYRLSAIVGTVKASSTPATLSLRCADSDTQIASLLLAGAARPVSTVSIAFETPTSNCIGQWLSIKLEGVEDSEMWLDKVKIVRN
jgi:tetratricopeptide (TPR) repeat protein